MSTSTSNKLVRSLQKLPENKRCFNCEVLGTNFIVPAFGIFVCTDCSGLHMKCGQRVKSISLGNYTDEEAKHLQHGGNEKASRVYLAKWSPNTSLQKPIDKKPPRVEEWIRTIFISKQYYSEEAAREAETSIPVKALSSILGNDIPKLQVHATVEDKPLKPGVKLPMPSLPTIKPVSVAVPEPAPQPEPEPDPQHAAAPPPPAAPALPAPKVQEVSLLDFGNSPVAASAPADAWSAFDSAPAAPASTNRDAFDPFGTFGSDAAQSTVSEKSASDPFSAPAGGLAQPAAAAFDPFSNHASGTVTAPQNTSTMHGAGFDPFSNSAAAPAAPAPPAAGGFADSAWSPFPSAAPGATAAARTTTSSDGFGLDVFQGMQPPANKPAVPGSVSSSHDFNPFPAANQAPARGSLSGSHEFNPFPGPAAGITGQSRTSVSNSHEFNAFSGPPATNKAPASVSGSHDFNPFGAEATSNPVPAPGSVSSSQDFNPFPTPSPTAQQAANGTAHPKNAPAELPSDLFSDSAFPTATFAGAQPFNTAPGMMGQSGMNAGPGGAMFPPSNFGGMGQPPAAQQMGFGGPPAGQYGGIRPTGAFPPQGQQPYGASGVQQFAGGMGGPGPMLGMGMQQGMAAGLNHGMGTQQGMGATQWGGLGTSTASAPSNATHGGYPQGGSNGPSNMSFSNQFGGMAPAGQMGMGQMGAAQGQHGMLAGFPGGVNAAPGFGTPQQGMSFNAFGPSGGMPGGLGGPGAQQFPTTNSFSMGPGAYGAGVTPPGAPKDDLAFADLVGDLKKALPTPSTAYGAAPAAYNAAPAFGGPANGTPGMMGGGGGYGGFGAMQAHGPGAPTYSTGSSAGNPFG